MLENHMVLGDYHIDGRPVSGRCECCNGEIRAGNGAYGGDKYYDFTGHGRGTVHAGCFDKWLEEFQQEGADEPAICTVCGEDQQEWLHYNLFGEVVCMSCDNEWGKDYLMED